MRMGEISSYFGPFTLRFLGSFSTFDMSLIPYGNLGDNDIKYIDVAVCLVTARHSATDIRMGRPTWVRPESVDAYGLLGALRITDWCVAETFVWRPGNFLLMLSLSHFRFLEYIGGNSAKKGFIFLFYLCGAIHLHCCVKGWEVGDFAF